MIFLIVQFKNPVNANAPYKSYCINKLVYEKSCQRSEIQKKFKGYSYKMFFS